MSKALRVLLQVVLWLAIAFAVFVGVILVGLLVHPEHPGNRLGAAILLVVVAGALAGAAWGLRRLRRPRFAPPAASAEPEPQPRPQPDLEPEAADTRRRVLAGETVVLRPSLRRTMVLGSICLMFLGIFALVFAEDRRVLYVVFALPFALGAVLWAMRLVPGRVFLRISPDGLTFRNAFATQRFAWNQIEGFTAYEIHNGYGSSQKLVGFDRRDVDRRRPGFWKMVGRGVSGVDVSLPDTYGLRHTDLAALLQDAHDRYATEFGPAPGELELLEEAASVRQDRLPLVTAVLALGCIAVFVIEVAHYGLVQDNVELYDAGAASRGALSAGRWWTLLWANVLHAGPVHLIANMFGLVLLGWLLEREVGWARMALLALAGGLAATGAAILIQPHTEVVGVSGVIFAILGWAVVRDGLRTRALGAAAWGAIVPGLVYTFLGPHVSIGAHVGGLAAGLVIGRAFERGDRTEREPEGPWVRADAPAGRARG